MFNFISVLLFITSYDVIRADDVTDGTELIFSLLIHRHGDRTPFKNNVNYSNDPTALEELTKPYGYGQLTDVGKRHSYLLGKYIARRYSELLAPKFNHSEVYIRSTDSTRTKMTILTALSSIYAPVHGRGWNDHIDWEPVPYSSIPFKYDSNLANVNCPKFMSFKSKAMDSPYPDMQEKYADILALLSRKTGLDASAKPFLAYSIYDLYATQLSLGLPLDDEITAVFDQIEDVAGAAIDKMCGDEEYKKYMAGVLLQDFSFYSDLALVGANTQRLRIYSAHDFNVYAFKAITEAIPRQGVPKFASAYSLELRKVTATGNYVVLPVYLPSPVEPEVYLHVKGCGDSFLCDYGRFYELTNKKELDEKTWRTECGFTEKLVVDESNLV